MKQNQLSKIQYFSKSDHVHSSGNTSVGAMHILSPWPFPQNYLRHENARAPIETRYISLRVPITKCVAALG